MREPPMTIGNSLGEPQRAGVPAVKRIKPLLQPAIEALTLSHAARSQVATLRYQYYMHILCNII
jgi:hypothetical protein